MARFFKQFLSKYFYIKYLKKGPDTQAGKVFMIKILKDKGSTGVKSENSPLTVTFLLFIRFLKPFRFLVWSKEHYLKSMVLGPLFDLL